MTDKIRSCWKRALVWLGVVLIYALPLVAVRGAFDMFLKIDGVSGESTDDKHLGWVDVLSFSHGISQPSAAASSGGARAAERAEHRNFTVMKHLDKSSPKLALFACNGSHIKYVTIEFCRAVGNKIKFMEYRLSDVIVSSIKPSGTAQGADSVPTEEVSFNYGKIEWNYTEIDTNGAPKGTVQANWDLLYNKGN